MNSTPVKRSQTTQLRHIFSLGLALLIPIALLIMIFYSSSFFSATPPPTPTKQTVIESVIEPINPDASLMISTSETGVTNLTSNLNLAAGHSASLTPHVQLVNDIKSRSLPFDPIALTEQSHHRFQITEDGTISLDTTAYQVSITEEKLAFVPATSDTQFSPGSTSFTLSLASVVMGQQDLLMASRQLDTTVEGNLVTLDYGFGLVEEYIARETGVEQRWWLENKPITEGDLTIAVNVVTALTAETTADGFIFHLVDPNTSQSTPAIGYGRPLAVDSVQQTLWGKIDAQFLAATDDGHNHYQLLMTFPAEWLAKAHYPLLIDPLITGLLRLEQGSPSQHQQHVQIAYNSDDDEFLLVWQDYRNGSNWDIYGQRLDGDGALVGDNFVIKGGDYDQDLPQLAYAPEEDRYLVIWRHYTSSTQHDLYGQLLSGDGQLVGSSFAIATGPGSSGQTPTDIVYNHQSNQFWALWVDERGSKDNIWGRHVSLSGSLGTEIQVTTSSTINDKQASIAYNGDDHQYLVVWTTKEMNLYGRRLAGSGVVTTTETITITTGTVADVPDLVYLESEGHYLVTWQDERDKSNHGSDIYGHLVNPDGSVIGTDFAINNTSANEQNPRLELSSNGGAWVVWQRYNDLTSGYDVYAQELTNNGQPITPTLVVYEDSTGSPSIEVSINQQQPTLSKNSDGNIIFLWQDDRHGNWDIYARLRLANGQIGGDFLVHPAIGDQEAVHIAYNSDDDEYLVVWQDFRDDLIGWQIFGQRVSSDGTLLGNNILISTSGTEPVVAYSSEDNNYLVVWTYNYELKGQRVTVGGTLSGSVYDAVPGLSRGALIDQPDIVYNPTVDLFLITARLREADSNTIHQIIAQPTPGLYSYVVLVSQEDIAVAEPNVAVADNGGYLIVWQDARNFDLDIYAYRLTSSGSITGTEFSVANTGWDESSPVAVWNSTASAYLIVWETLLADINVQSAIQGQRVNNQGSLVGDPITFTTADLLISGDTGIVSNPSIASTDGKWLVVWQEERNNATETDIKGRSLRSDGILLGETITLVVHTEEQINPVIVGGEQDFSLLAWQDNREGGWDLYASLYQMDAMVTGVTATNNSPNLVESTTFFSATVTSGTNVVYLWSFGDGNIDVGQLVTHIYNQPGIYTAIVTATNSNNLITATTVVTVYQPLTVDFTAAPRIGYAPHFVEFTNNSIGADSYEWDFGDGFGSTEIEPTHTYSNTGTYTVTLTATGLDGTANRVRTRYITAIDPTTPGIPHVAIEPTITTVDVSDSFTVTVVISGLLTPVSAYQFDVVYDDELLYLENVTSGDFLATAWQDVICPPWATPTTNSLRLVCVSVGPQVGATGSGVLATLRFTAIDSGNAEIYLTSVQLPDTLVPPGAITATLVNGFIVINDNDLALLGVGTEGNGSGHFKRLTWSNANWSDVTIKFMVLISLGTMVLCGFYLNRRKQLSAIWRVIVSVSMMLQLAIIIPSPVRASVGQTLPQDNRQDSALYKSSTLTLPSFLTTQPPLDCYQSDIDCDKDVDEADVGYGASVWNCTEAMPCFVALVDMDSNDVIDAFDLAWITNEYDIKAPEVFITNPQEGSIVAASPLQVTGIFTDRHEIATVLVNGITADIVDNTFSVDVPVQPGNNVLDIVVWDVVGQVSLTNRVVTFDQSGPTVRIIAPRDGQAVYTDQPPVEVEYGDFLADIDPDSFSAVVRDAESNIVQTIGNSVAGATSAQFILDPLSLDAEYTLSVSIADEYGNTSLTTSSFYVTPDTEINPPIMPEQPGWVMGRVLDSSSCDQHLTSCGGIAGAEVTLLQVDAEALATVRSVRGEQYGLSSQFNGTFPAGNTASTSLFAAPITGTLLTGPDGFFAFPVATTGIYHIRVDKEGFTYGQQEVAIVINRSTAANEIYLTPIDPALTLCENSGCTHTSADGQMMIEIPAEAIPANEQVEVTATEFDRVYFLPSGQLPPGTLETYAFNLGGSSDYEFQKPITVSLKNTREFTPGTTIPLGYWNQHTLQWEHAGMAVIDETGEWVVMKLSHFSNYDPNLASIFPRINADGTDYSDPDSRCADGESGCFINLKSGVVKEWINLPAINLPSVASPPQLIYSTDMANPGAVIDIKLDVSLNSAIFPKGYLLWELYIEGQNTDSLTLEADITSSGEVGRYRYLWDGRNALGELLSPGIYGYAVRIRIPYVANYCIGAFFSGMVCSQIPAGINSPNGVTAEGIVDVWVYGEAVLNSQVNNALGSGWVLNDQEFLYEDEAGRILITSGNALTQYYFSLQDLLAGQQIYNTPQPPVIAPASANFPVADVTGGTYVSGTINTNTTWSLVQSPYIVQGDDVTVSSGITLTIEPGVEVLLEHGHSVIVDGTLNAQGTATTPITFTAYYSPENGFSDYGESFQTLSLYDIYPYYGIHALTVDQGGDVWVAGSAFAQYGGNVRAIQRLHRNHNIRDRIELPGTFIGSYIRDIAVDNAGRKWFATDDGVLMLAADDVTWTHYRSQNSNLVDNDVRAVVADMNNTVWFAIYDLGNDGGLQSLSGSTWATYDTNDGLPSNHALSLDIDTNGNLWIGTDDGLARFNPGTNSWASYDVTDVDENWPNIIETLSADLAGNVWVTVPGTGVAVLTVTTNTWTDYSTELLGSDVLTIKVDDFGRKWIGYESSGVSVLSSNNADWDHKSEIGLAEAVNDIAISPITGDVWLAVDDGTIIRNYITNLYLDGTIIGGYWGQLKINGSAELEYITLEMGGVYGQSTLSFNQATMPSDVSNVIVRASGGHGVEVEGTDLTLVNVTVLANRGNGLHVGADSSVELLTFSSQENQQSGIFLGAGSIVTGSDVALSYNNAAIYTNGVAAAIDLTELLIEGNNGTTRLPINTYLDEVTWQNNRRNTVEWLGGTITDDWTWPTINGVELHAVSGMITVDSSATLTLLPGTLLAFTEVAGLNVAGTLIAVGTYDAPVDFSPSIPGWNGIALTGVGSELAYVVIQNAQTGLTVNGVDLTMSFMTFASNFVGIQVENEATVTITQSNFVGNATAIVNNAGASYPVEATENYWGHPDGPTHSSNQGGAGDSVTDDVDFSPWRLPVLLNNTAFFIENRTETNTSRLLFNPTTGAYTRYYANGRVVYFDTHGRHDYTLYPDGRKLTYTYNIDGTTATVEATAPGQSTPEAIWQFNYEDGRLDHIIDPVGREIEFTLDNNNQLRQVNVPGLGSRHFYYNEQNLLTQQQDEGGAVTSYLYNEYGRLVEHHEPLREVYDPDTQTTTLDREIKLFANSDTSYALLNTSEIGDPDDPAPAVLKTDDLVDAVAYGIGGRTAKTNQWGHIVEQTDSLDRTISLVRDEANRVTRIDLPNGDCIEANYDGLGNVLAATRLPAAQCILPEEIRDPEQAQTFTRTYEPRFNYPKSATTPTGETTLYYYDYELDLGNVGRVVRIDYPEIPDENGTLTTPSVFYTYNSLGQVETKTDVRGVVTRYVYTEGTSDEASNGVTPLFAPGVTPVAGYLTQVIMDDGDSDEDGFEYITTYKEFDALGNPQLIIFPGGHQVSATYDTLGRLVTNTDSNGIVTFYEYNDRGQIVRQIADYTADGLTGDNVITTYSYDSGGRLIHQRTAADGLVVETYSRYDLNGRLVSQSDGQGNETRYLYDEAGQLIETIDPAGHSTSYTYTVGGLPETVTDADGYVTRTLYDEFGRVRQTIQAENELNLTTTYTYTVDNQVASIAPPDGMVTCFAYDSSHRRTQTIQDCGPGGLNLTTRYAYDVAGNTVYITNTRGIVTYNEYDALGRVVLTRQDDGGLNHETSTSYGAAGNTATTVSVDGTITEYHYDNLNRLEQLCRDSDGLNLCTTYLYDRQGRQEQVIDAEGVVQRTIYNRLGLAIQHIADAHGMAATVTLEYNHLLNLVQVTDANGNATQYSYTARQEKESELYADGTTVSYTYNPRGHLATTTLQDSAIITRTYDAAGRQIQQTFSIGGQQEFTYDTAGRLITAAQTLNGYTTLNGYGYNAVGDVITTTQQLDSGTVWLTQYAYDYSQGTRTVTYPSGAVRIYTTDSLNRLDTVETGSSTVIADYTYDVVNRFNTVAYPGNGLTNRTDYNPLGWITRVTVNDGNDDVVDYGYSYDDVGNRTFSQRHHQAGSPADVYQYDSLYQLVNVWYGADETTPEAITSAASAQEYGLDLLGNRLFVLDDETETSYGPHDGSQLTNVMNRYESVEGEPLGYDLRGNTLTDGQSVYTYDVLNRQTSVTNSHGTTTYVYDGRGRRIAKIHDNQTTHYLYDSQYRIIEERDDNEDLVARYTYGQGMDEPLTMERDSQTYYYHRDALGSVTEVTDSSGEIVERYEYDVYGAFVIFDENEDVIAESAIGNPYLFTGREYDPESGNYYYRARIYSPALGRFLSQDPLGFDAGDYNLYRYVFNNPVNAIDPTGELAFIPLLIGAAAITLKVVDYAWTAWDVSQATRVLSDECAEDLDKLLAGFEISLAIIFELLEPDEWLPVATPVDDIARRRLMREVREVTQKEGMAGFERVVRRNLGDAGADRVFREMGLDDLVRYACSFSADTTVMTDQGDIPISDLEEGMVALAYNEETEEIDYYPVIATWSHQDPVIQYLTIDGELIKTTPNHPFYTAMGEWVAAGKLQIGDTIRNGEWEVGTVEAITFVYQPRPMYNLTVDTAHTYFVGDGQWLVHNSCINLPKWKPGDPTRGVIDINNSLTPLISGKNGGPALQMPPGTPGFDPRYHSTTHVESHAAAYMRQNRLTEATLYINKSPCGGDPKDLYGCQQLLGQRLPAGAKLHIYVGDGANYQFFNTFTGLSD